jgi:hypothetical protein
MELILVVLFFGPFVAKLINERDHGVTLGFVIGNIIVLGVAAGLFKLVHESLGQGLAMLIGWLGLVAIQALFFWWAMEGTKWRRSVEASWKKGTT